MPNIEVRPTVSLKLIKREPLGLIAEKYGVGIYDICALNNLTNPNLIYVGQVLKIK